MLEKGKEVTPVNQHNVAGANGCLEDYLVGGSVCYKIRPAGAENAGSINFCLVNTGIFPFIRVGNGNSDRENPVMSCFCAGDSVVLLMRKMADKR
jgi:hypothetical protein